MVEWYDIQAMTPEMEKASFATAAAASPVLQEFMASGCSEPVRDFLPIELRVMVSRACGSRGIATGTATFPPGSVLPYHTHECGEAITILSGVADVVVAGRRYRLSRLDSMFVPMDIPHSVRNLDTATPFVAHSAFSISAPGRYPVAEVYEETYRGDHNPMPGEPERLRRFADAEMYHLADGTRFCDLFASRLGSTGICGGYGEFDPGAFLPCHIHKFDESITIVRGEAVCRVQGKEYSLSGCDTAFVPEGRPHCFLNQSAGVMAMIWVYAGNEPERTTVPMDYCIGSLPWPGVDNLDGKQNGPLDI